MTGSRWGATGRPVVPGAALALVLVLLIGPAGLAPTPLRAPSGTRFASDGAASPWSAANLTITPASAWADGGTPTPLRAVWSTGTAACAVVPQWFLWSPGPGGVGGSFDSQNSSAVNFTGTSSTSGTARVTVRSAAEVECGSTWDAQVGVATATLTEVAPLAVEDVGMVPLLAAGRFQANLTGAIAGGMPPYAVTIDWQDGSVGTRSVPTAGAFRWPHTYLPGTYAPNFTVVDSSGQSAAATASQPVTIDAGAAGAVIATAPTAETGRELRFSGAVLDVPSTAVSTLSGCGLQVVGSPADPPSFLCDPGTPGTLAVHLTVSDRLVGVILSQTLEEPVVRRLAVAVTPSAGEAEVGVPTAASVTIAGGTPPFVVSWGLGATPTGSLRVVPGDGIAALPVEANATGLVRLSVTVADADDASVTVANESLFVGPELTARASANSSVDLPVARVECAALVTGGVGPIAWAITASPGFVPGTSPTGWLPSAGGFTWVATFSSEGTAALLVSVEDAAGGSVNASVPVALLPALFGSLSVRAVNATDGPGIDINLTLSGGVPPFTVWINASGGASWNATDPSDGVFDATVPLARAGPTSVTVVAVDQLGARLTGSTVVITRAPPLGLAAAPPDPWAPVAAVLLLGGALGVAALVLWRRRRERAGAPAAPPDPVEVLHRILAPADGAERVTVELLAEEAGVPLETVRTTLDRLIATGVVRSEASDGEEVLAWTDTT